MHFHISAVMEKRVIHQTKQAKKGVRELHVRRNRSTTNFRGVCPHGKLGQFLVRCEDLLALKEHREELTRMLKDEKENTTTETSHRFTADFENKPLKRLSQVFERKTKKTEDELQDPTGPISISDIFRTGSLWKPYYTACRAERRRHNHCRASLYWHTWEWRIYSVRTWCWVQHDNLFVV